MPTDPKSKAGESLQSPWKEFLSELDSILPEPLDLHCVGGFVICFFYGCLAQRAISTITRLCRPTSI
jgi:hypothetical protein